VTTVDLAEARGNVETVEMELLLEGVYRQYGYDFRGYAPGSLKRRLWRRAYAEKAPTLSALQERVLHDPGCMERLLQDLSISVTSMFRDPGFYVALRENVIPRLRTYPFVRIWNAGCSTGEETYSLAILFREAGLGERVRIYATDINDSVVARARSGMFPLERMRDYTENYVRAGGGEEFSSYYTAEGDHARFDPALTDRIVFAQHNLASDRAFNTFNLVVCRNVMIYFGKELQDRVHDLLYESLETFGMLALGRKESIKFSPRESCYEPLDPDERIYRKLS
jgi:chemotaxis protein methyltransferase CheR